MMDRRLSECLSGNESTEYILPFFWQHGETHDRLKEEIDAIERCGIRQFCVESRVHPDFCGEKWWDDFGFILEEAKKRDMRVWLLDDVRFPSGTANGYISKHRELRRMALKCEYFDYCGPCDNGAILVPDTGEGRLLAVLAYRRKENGDILEDECLDLGTDVTDGIKRITLPSGCFRIYFLMCGPYSKQWMEGYVDMLSYDSCGAMIKGVYEPHYAHFSAYFGNTFVGFFSDEPNFANDSGDFHSMFGKDGMLFPWRDDLPDIISEYANITPERVIELLPCLWHSVRGCDSRLRPFYMEAVTRLFRRNFSCQLGDWCHEHGVRYIGHIIEDMETHQRLGIGPGHFFRALDGQDMGGCDVVIQQIMPGFTELDHTSQLFGGRADPEFFDYALAKMASSHSHIQKRKDGRAMCELFGAFGWAEGIPMMKWMSDHLLVSGINRFVPHAFSPKYPDPDCPPHFYAGGTNPQFGMFGGLMAYLRRSAHVLSGGIHRPVAAVFYNAAAEWSGGAYDFFRKTARVLARAQLDYDIVPEDYLAAAGVGDGGMTINGETYPVLIVPYSEILPSGIIETIRSLSDKGMRVIWAENTPSRTAEGEELFFPDSVAVVKTEELPQYIEELGLREIFLSKPLPELRYFHTVRDGGDVCMFFNNDIHAAADFEVSAGFLRGGCLYDAGKNSVFLPQMTEKGMRLRLAPGSAVIYVSDASAEEPYDYSDWTYRKIDPEWDLFTMEYPEDAYTYYGRVGCEDLSLREDFRRFCGRLLYTAELDFGENGIPSVIDFGYIGETAQVTLNGISLGSALSVPYSFRLTPARRGRNLLAVEVAANPVYRNRDDRSQYLILPKMGIVGEVRLGF